MKETKIYQKMRATIIDLSEKLDEAVAMKGNLVYAAGSGSGTSLTNLDKTHFTMITLS